MNELPIGLIGSDFVQAFPTLQMLDGKRTNPKLKNKNRKLRKNESESRDF
jgi:hypothetical protein